MTYDAADGYVVAFGGCNSIYCGSVTNQTWVLANGNWTNVTKSIAPPANSGATITYDAADGYVVFFGGPGGGGVPSNETWKFTAGNWTMLHPSTVPRGRGGAAMTYDPADHYVLLFGGTNSSGDLNDTWTFYSGNWHSVNTSRAPVPAGQAVLTWDATDGYALYYGGAHGGGGYLGNTWTYVHGNWTELSPSSSPGVMSLYQMSYDSLDGYVLLYGGYNNIWYSNTWAYANGTWTELGTSGAPGSLNNAQMVFDAHDGYIVMYGGMNGGGPESTTWIWNAPNVSVVGSTHRVDVGQTISFTGNDSGPFGPLTVSWNSAFGCAPAGALNTTCRATTAGIYYDMVTVNDSNGALDWAGWNLTVRPIPVALAPVVTPIRGEANLTVNASARPTAGTGVYSAVEWSGQPAGCPNVTALNFSCWLSTPVDFSLQYRVTDSSNATSFWSPPVSVTIYPHLDPLPLPRASANPLEVGGNVQFTTSPHGGTGAYTNYTWSGLNQSLGSCGSVYVAVVSCSVAHPGTFKINVTVIDSLGNRTGPSPTLSVLVYSRLAVLSVEVNRTAMDQGQIASYSVLTTGGAPGGLRYAWTGLPIGCVAGNVSSFSCVPSRAGLYSPVSVTVSDALQVSAMGRSPALRVNSALQITGFYGPANLTLGGFLNLSTEVLGGAAPYNYTYSGLPSNCTSVESARLSCSPTGTGTFRISVVVSDRVNGTATSNLSVTITRPYVPPTTPSSGPPPPNLLPWVAVGLVAAVVATIAIILIARRRPAIAPEAPGESEMVADPPS